MTKKQFKKWGENTRRNLGISKQLEIILRGTSASFYWKDDDELPTIYALIPKPTLDEQILYYRNKALDPNYTDICRLMIDELNSQKISEYRNANRTLSNLEDIKSIPIEKFVDLSHPKAWKSQDRIKICCPFHNEKTPSFVINRKTNKYKCFGCQARGSVIDFIMNKMSLTLPEAINWLKLNK